MSTDNRLMIKNLQKLEAFYSVTSQATHLPYAECDPETFDDQIRIFAEQADADAYCARLKEENYPCVTARIEKDGIQSFYTGLYLTGINRLAFHNGSGFTYLPLDSVVTVRKPEQKENTPPVMNASLQLTGVYFLQELRRPGLPQNDPERTARLRELEQELMANLTRSRFIAVLDVTDLKGKLDLRKPNPDVKLPYLKSPSGDVMQPLFSDLWEFEKFRGKSERKLQLLTLPFQSLSKPLVAEAKGYTLNPSGFNLLLLKDKIAQLAGEDPEA